MGGGGGEGGQPVSEKQSSRGVPCGTERVALTTAVGNKVTMTVPPPQRNHCQTAAAEPEPVSAAVKQNQ